MRPIDNGDRWPEEVRARAEVTEEASSGGGDGYGSNGGGPGRGTWQDLAPSIMIVQAIARREGVEITDLPPLYGSVDTDSLDMVLRSAPGATVTFIHHGYEVRVTGTGDVNLVRLHPR